MARTKEGVAAYVELGPKSRALLRRLVLALELYIGHEVPDPGIDSEENADTENQ